MCDAESRARCGFTGKKLNWPLVGRALFKIGLGMVAMKQGREYACGSKFDIARDFISGKSTIKSKMLVRSNSQPHPQVQVVYLDQPGTPMFIDFFGLSFMLSLEASPEINLHDDLVSLGFEMVSLEPQAASSAASKRSL